jgi:hypothetical protein
MKRRLGPASLAVALCALLGAMASPARAQGLDAPPPLPAPASATSPRNEPSQPPVEVLEELPELPPARKPQPETRIEQRRAGNRIVEVTVTPAGSSRSYTIVNREGQRPANVQELSSGLSTPRFFKFEF